MNNTSEEVALEVKAQNLVDKVFKDSVDIGGEPYHNHLMAVRSIASKVNRLLYNSDHRYLEHLGTVALLHDLLEVFPEEFNYDYLVNEFNKEIADAVLLLTKKNREKYDKYLKEISTNILATIVKIADLTHNMDLTRLKRHLTEEDINRVCKYHKGYLYLMDKLKNLK